MTQKQSGDEPVQSADSQIQAQLNNEIVPPASPGTSTSFFARKVSPLRPHFFRPEVSIIGRIPTVFFTPRAFKHTLLYIELAEKEVGWLATVSRLPSGDFLIDETFLLRQTVHSSETELSIDGINELAMELMSLGNPGIEKCNKLRFWGHSHVFMPTHPSGTDEMTMQHRQKEGTPWYVRGIFNKLGHAEFTVYDFERGIKVVDAPWAIYDPATGETLKQSSYNGRRLRRLTAGLEPANAENSSIERPAFEEVRGNKTGLSWESLAPDEQLRNLIKAEYADKVVEREPIWKLNPLPPYVWHENLHHVPLLNRLSPLERHPEADGKPDTPGIKPD